ncbi:MAG: hypothetical protein LC713_06265 [Actinobacteria bacterium]|nr:hypothetical protein [Actinomycetota bacterium]
MAAIAAQDAGAASDDDAVTWAADELRSNIDRNIGERALAAIAVLRPQLGDALAILSDAELLNAYGARDAWQLTDQLARLELGDTRDIARHQALAASGTVVIAWLASDDGELTEEVADAARSWLAAAHGEPSP